jgi:hypothetical protein
MKRKWILVVALTALAASVAGISNQFVQDDPAIIAENTRIHDLGNWREIVRSPYWPPPWAADLYRPLASLLLAVEYRLGSGDPLVFRITSYFLYAATAVLILALARRLLTQRIAIGVALVFAAHPVHVEAVALGVAQNELFVGLLSIVMMITYLDARRAADRLTAGQWAAVGGLYLASCLLKENALILPGLLLAAELFLFSGPVRQRMKRLAPGYGFLLSIGLLVLLARTAVLSGHIGATAPADALVGLSLAGRALTMLKVVPQWGRLLFWPAHLQADYSPQEMIASTAFGGAELLGVLMLLGLVGVVWLARHRAPILAFGVSWTTVALIPISNVLVPTGVLLAERTLFLPSIGFVLAIGGLLDGPRRNSEKTSRCGASPTPANPRRRLTVLSYWTVVITLTALGVLRSAERQGTWRSEDILAERNAVDAPRSWRTQKELAYRFLQRGERENGLALFVRAVALAPPEQVWRVRNSLAERYFDLGENRLAVEQLRQSLVDSPDKKETWRFLILGYLSLGAYSEAARLSDSALALGGPAELFGPLKALADTALKERLPVGSIRVEVTKPHR